MYVWMLLICMFCVFIKCLLCEVEWNVLQQCFCVGCWHSGNSPVLTI
jgi:hypothetical protein